MASCETCRFGVLHPRTEMRDCPGMAATQAWVECRRSPPLPKRPQYGVSHVIGTWPAVHPSDWCGEFATLQPAGEGA